MEPFFKDETNGIFLSGKLLPNGSPRYDLRDGTQLFHDETESQMFMEKQLEIEESIRRSIKNTVKSHQAEADSDEELKLELRNAVRQYKKNKKENNVVGDGSFFDAHTSKTNSEIKTDTGENLTYAGSVNHNCSYTVKNLSTKEHERTNKTEKLRTDVTSKDGTNESAISDIQQLINFFFLKTTDQTKKFDVKKYSDYEKQGAIPKGLVREKVGSEVNTNINHHLSQHVKTVEMKSNHNYSKNKPNSTFTFNKADFSNKSDVKIVKLSEKICSRPFYYVVPANPSPTFLFPRGSYYVIPVHPNSESGERIISHPEATYKYNISEGGENFEIKISGKENGNMNDLGKEVDKNTDGHLNIGPADVLLNATWCNLESNICHRKKNEKHIEFEAVIPCDNNHTSCETSEEREEEAETEDLAPRVAQFAFKESLNDDIPIEDTSRAQQSLMSVFSGPDEASALCITNNFFHDESVMEDNSASTNLEKKIEDQFLRMLSALPERNVEELRQICDQFNGDEELVSSFIEETQRDNLKHQRALELQFILPDADPDYLFQEIERLGGNEEAINNLTAELLDGKGYPKILKSHVDPERERLWKMYVENFNVASYLRNVPDPKNFPEFTAAHPSEKYRELALEFLCSRYPSRSPETLRNIFSRCSNSLTIACSELPLSESAPVSLARSSIKSKDFDENFLKEICYIDHKKEIDDYLDELKELKQIEIEEAQLNDTFLLCPLCCNDELVTSDAVTCEDGHIFCKDCVKRYVFVKLGDGIYKYSCPSDDCETFFTHATLEKLLPDTVLSNIIKKQQAAELNTAGVDGLETCPFCEFAYVPDPQDKIFKCQNYSCLIESCRKCREKSHIPLRCEEIERKQDLEARKKIEESMTERLVRICPTCFKKFVKIDGCNKMTCPCGTVVCYYCRRKIDGYSHFSQSAIGSKCPLYSNNSILHTDDVVQAGVAARNQILQEDPDIRLLYDPTRISDK